MTQMTRTPDNLSFGRAITEARVGLGLTQPQLATAMQVGLNTVSKWELGKTGIRKRHRKVLMEYLGIEDPKVQAPDTADC